MPGLPTMTPDEDISDFKKLFNDSNLKPDMLKIYPSLVLENTALYDDFVAKKYIPYSDEEMLTVLTEAKKIVPKWVRIMRVQREITPNEIQAGPKLGNLRQIIHKRLEDQGYACKCIRCREAGLSRKNTPSELLKLDREEYDSSGASFIRGVIFVEKVQDIVFTHSPELEITERLVEQLFEFGIELNCDVRKGGVKLAEKVAKRIYCAVDEDVALAAVNQLRENLGVDSRDRQTSNSDNNCKCCLGFIREPILLVPDCCRDDTLKLSEVKRVEISDLTKCCAPGFLENIFGL